MIELVESVPCHIQLIMEKSLKLFLDSSHNLKKSEIKRRLAQNMILAKADRANNSPYMRVKIEAELNDPCNWLLAYIYDSGDADFEGFSLVVDYLDEAKIVWRFYYALGLRGDDGFYSLTHVKKKLDKQPAEYLYRHKEGEIEARRMPFTVAS